MIFRYRQKLLMRTREKGSLAGGCLGGTLGGLAGIVLGGWIACIAISTKVELPKIGEPPIPLLVLMQLYIVAYGVPVLLGSIVGGIVGFMGGSLIGAATFPRLDVTLDVAANDADVERHQGQLGWVNCAIYGLVAIGVFGVLLSTLWLISEEDKVTPVAFMLWALMGLVSGIMLSKRARAGKVLGVIFVLPGLLLFPHGTVVALILLYALCCDQTTRYLVG